MVAGFGLAFAVGMIFVLALYRQDGRGLSPLVSGVVFSAVGAGLAHAFAVSLVVLAALTVATAALVQLLPRPGPAS